MNDLIEAVLAVIWEYRKWTRQSVTRKLSRQFQSWDLWTLARQASDEDLRALLTRAARRAELEEWIP